MSSTQFGCREYWQSRYLRDAQPFSWYQSFDSLSPLLLPLLAAKPGGADVLVAGCGSDGLPAALAAAAPGSRVTCVDWSSAVIDAQAARHRGVAGLRWLVGDAAAPGGLAPAAAAADLVLDKACLDATLCSEASLARVAALVDEAHRVLRVGGAYVVVSHGAPEARLSFLNAPAPAAARWSITAHAIRACARAHARARASSRGRYDTRYPPIPSLRSQANHCRRPG